MQQSIAAVIFDLYGTLIRVTDQSISRGIPRLLGAGRRRWMELVRGELLTHDFGDRAEFVRFILSSLAPAETAEKEQRCLELVEQEIASVEPSPGALSLLAFLKRRGYALGLLSNLSSVHKEPVERLGFAEHFEAVAFSCELGYRKPDPRLYLDLSQRLAAAPGATLVVGDSLKNDVVVPRELGMRALRVSGSHGDGALGEVAELGWMSLGDGEPHRLLSNGDRIELGDVSGVLREFRSLPDAEQGRYNLVASARVEVAGAETEAGWLEVFCKRFLFPEGAHVEEFVHRLHQAIGIPVCRAAVTASPEPCLVVSKAPGAKFAGGVDTPLAYELGRHCTAAYLFSNADLRPRNAFVAHAGGRPVVTMVDLEHCLFNLALDVSGLEDPKSPEQIDRLGEAELDRRVRKRVLSPRTTRRARRSFFETDSLDSALARAFREGWVSLYREVQKDADRLCGLIEERIYREPYLIIGTQSYRRAMAGIDLADIRLRLAQDPEVVFEEYF